MSKISCSVTDCSFNNSRACYANQINVGGIGATKAESTCCGSFLNKDAYSNLAEATMYKDDAVAITCEVGTCKYNTQLKCTLDCIDVTSKGTGTTYTETECSSFEMN